MLLEGILKKNEKSREKDFFKYFCDLIKINGIFILGPKGDTGLQGMPGVDGVSGEAGIQGPPGFPVSRVN